MSQRVLVGAGKKVLLAVAMIVAMVLIIVNGAACSCGEADAPTSTGITTTSTSAVASVESETTQTSVVTEPATTTTSSAQTVTTWGYQASTTTMSLVPLQVGITVQVMPSSWNHIEESSSSVHYSGTWMGVMEPDASGGQYRRAAQSGAAAEVVFSGTRIRLVGFTGPNMGRAKVTLDSSGPVNVDMYDAEGGSEVVWTSGTLVDGPHTLKVEWSGAKNPSATGTVISIDAIEVLGVFAI